MVLKMVFIILYSFDILIETGNLQVVNIKSLMCVCSQHMSLITNIDIFKKYKIYPIYLYIQCICVCVKFFHFTPI